MRKDMIKSLISIKQYEMPSVRQPRKWQWHNPLPTTDAPHRPFDVIHRDEELPINRQKIITIPGVRRCGKSTLMEIAVNELLASGISKERILWIGFDDERLRKMSSDDLDEVLSAYMEMFPDIPIREVYMFFDEIQFIEGWEYFVLRVFKSYCKNIYVCGSNVTMLSTELSSALRGYLLEYKTYPLSFREYCRFRGVNTRSFLEQDRSKGKNVFAAYIHSSSFPEIVLTDLYSEKLKLLHGYFDMMLLKDIAGHYQIAQVSVLRYFIKRVLANLSKPTSILSIYNDIKSQGLKISKDELYKWGNYICEVFMFVRIPKYERSLAKEQKSQHKYYCIDNGLYSAILLPQGDDNRKLLENTVLLHLTRWCGLADKVFYYMGTSECDFVVQRNEQVDELIQVTWELSDEKIRQREINGLLEASKVTLCDKMTIITCDEEGSIEHEGKKINIQPAWKWLLQG